MHPILFRIPLPHFPLKLWWGFAFAAALSMVFAALGFRQKDRGGAISSLAVAAALAFAGVTWRASSFEAPDLPIYAYGVMLGLSLVVGWTITLRLTDKDGLPKETMANCYVVTAVAALLGSRLLYVATNPDDYKSFADIVALRNGGLVAYGGFLGGFLGSWAFLAPKRIRLLAWADAAVPSLATGLFITRIGCYLFGCDFGVRLSDKAPAFLKRMGTFPHWPAGTLASGDGSPAFVRHLELYKDSPLEVELLKANTSFPVHPTQLYEAAIGLLLFGLIMYVRKRTKFRGEAFFVFAFAYGAARFLIELLRDDTERGAYGPVLDQHIYISGALLLLAVGFIFGVSLIIENKTARTIASGISLLPSVVAYAMLVPPSFGKTVAYQLSESQLIGLLSALTVSYFFAKQWTEAKQHPDLAMSLGDPASIRALLEEGAETKSEEPPQEADKKQA